MGKHCDRCVHVTACIATLFAILSSVAFIVLAGMREETLLNLDEYHEIVHEWDAIPYVSVAIVKAEDRCPVSHPSLLIYDSWPGLEIKCYCEPSAEFKTVYGVACLDGRADTTKCITRDAIPTLYMGVLNGQKVCGERGGASFKNAKRPIDQGNGYLKCPADTVPCDEDVFPSAAKVLSEADKKEAEYEAALEDYKNGKKKRALADEDEDKDDADVVVIEDDTEAIVCADGDEECEKANVD